MIDLYVSLVLKGAKKLEEVPATIRKEVEKLVKAAKQA